MGETKLTEQELSLRQGLQPEHLTRQFVSNWVTTELLYQEALRKGFAKSEEVQEQIEEATRQLAINAFLEKEIYGENANKIDEADLETEFATNREAYRLQEDIVKISFAVFDERDAANTFRSKVLRGSPWKQGVESIQGDAESKTHLLRVASDEYFAQQSLYPEELWKVARSLSKGDVSYVVRTSAGYCVVLLYEIRRQGELPDLEFVKDEIRQRLLLKLRNRKYGELLERLRSKSDVEVHIARSDTAG